MCYAARSGAQSGPWEGMKGRSLQLGQMPKEFNDLELELTLDHCCVHHKQSGILSIVKGRVLMIMRSPLSKEGAHENQSSKEPGDVKIACTLRADPIRAMESMAYTETRASTTISR